MCARVAYQSGVYNLLKKRKATEALRKAGLTWDEPKDGEGREGKRSSGKRKGPLTSLQPKWLPYVNDPAWLTVTPWIEKANLLTREEVYSGESSPETLEKLPLLTNFEIGNYRSVEPEQLLPLLRNAYAMLDTIVSVERPAFAGADHVAPDPYILFLMAIAITDPSRLRRCAVCRNFIYLKRKDQKTCPGACSNTARQRRFREKKHYNSNRKKNRLAKKAQGDRQTKTRLNRLREPQK
jgi:hypothetical protein